MTAMADQPIPQPPPRIRVQPGVCGAPASREDTSRLCGERASFYACGWRCDDHRPGRR